ncbi:MAG: protein kinase, partial [Mycobacterium sp.]|nr:protein kinase [Mycobacterium sp.]
MSIAQTLGVTEPHGGSLFETLVDWLIPRKVLLILDNFEHLVPAAVSVADLLAACPALHVLVTSRVLLRLYGEREVPVPPLALPDHRAAPTARHLSQFESIRLFVDRAQAARADFVLTDVNAASVSHICQRVDGLPLALELAAARLREFSLGELAGRVDKRLPLLTGGPRDRPERQRTLRDTIAWSYDLLDPAAQMLFRRLGVFHGCTVEAALEVCSPASAEPDSRTVAVAPLQADLVDCLTTLVDNSLLVRAE